MCVKEPAVESRIAEWQDRTFRVAHAVRRGSEVLLEGSELRCRARPHPDDPLRFEALPIPAEFRAAPEQT